MPGTIEYCFYEEGRETTFLVLRENETKNGIEGYLACIDIHQVAPPAEQTFHSYSQLRDILSKYKNMAFILKEIEKTKKFPRTAVIGN